eukprot:TRINITY_DN958_c0_g1_i1.p1 TRINITY_DN958_c0_g1~~TRINITY_DN958_c0_g1_i1.p1  ORF type:complete len:1271 (+),score=253.32 TRINITY_DN958_c0_g1_i1:91-3903(+)
MTFLASCRIAGCQCELFGNSPDDQKTCSCGHPVTSHKSCSAHREDVTDESELRGDEYIPYHITCGAPVSAHPRTQSPPADAPLVYPPMSRGGRNPPNADSGFGPGTEMTALPGGGGQTQFRAHGHASPLGASPGDEPPLEGGGGAAAYTRQMHSTAPSANPTGSGAGGTRGRHERRHTEVRRLFANAARHGTGPVAAGAGGMRLPLSIGSAVVGEEPTGGTPGSATLPLPDWHALNREATALAAAGGLSSACVVPVEATPPANAAMPSLPVAPAVGSSGPSASNVSPMVPPTAPTMAPSMLPPTAPTMAPSMLPVIGMTIGMTSGTNGTNGTNGGRAMPVLTDVGVAGPTAGRGREPGAAAGVEGAPDGDRDGKAADAPTSLHAFLRERVEADLRAEGRIGAAGADDDDDARTVTMSVVTAADGIFNLLRQAVARADFAPVALGSAVQPLGPCISFLVRAMVRQRVIPASAADMATARLRGALPPGTHAALLHQLAAVFLPVRVKDPFVYVARLQTPVNLGAPDRHLTQYVAVVVSDPDDVGEDGREPLHEVLQLALHEVFAERAFHDAVHAARTPDDLDAALAAFVGRQVSEEEELAGAGECGIDDDTSSRWSVPPARPGAGQSGGFYERARRHREGAPGKLRFTKRFAGGMWEDLKRRVAAYPSDIMMGAHAKVISATFFLFFACLGPAVTYGSVLSVQTEGQMTVGGAVLGAGIAGVLWALFAGEPIIILGATGPTLIFTNVLFNLSQTLGVPFLPMYGWTALWCCAFCIIVAVADLAAVMRWCTRFTDEIFAVLVSMYYIVTACKNIAGAFEHSPAAAPPVLAPTVTPTGIVAVPTTPWPGIGGPVSAPALPASSPMNSVPAPFPGSLLPAAPVAAPFAIAPAAPGVRIPVPSAEVPTGTPASVWGSVTLSADPCSEVAAAAAGLQNQVEYVRAEGVGLLSLVMALLSYYLLVVLKEVRGSPYVHATVRNIVSDFNSAITIVVLSIADYLLFDDLHVAKLNVPSSPAEAFIPGYIVPLGDISVGMAMLCAVPGIFMCILLYMDNNLSKRLVNAPDKKLQKGTAYHWDMVVIGIVNAVLGLLAFPFVEAAAVRCLAHLNALADAEDRVEDGHTKKHIIFVQENRISPLAVHILIGVSLYAGPVLSFVGLPTLDGLFLFMGLVSLFANPFWERLMLVMTEPRLYPPSHVVRTVPKAKLHFFTFLQAVGFGILWGVKDTPVGLIFPLILLLFIPFRKVLMPRLFTKTELRALDNDREAPMEELEDLPDH